MGAVRQLVLLVVLVVHTVDSSPVPSSTSPGGWVTSPWKEEEVPWVRTRAPSPFIDARHDSFTAQCYQLGKIELADFLPPAYRNLPVRSPFATSTTPPAEGRRRIKRWRPINRPPTSPAPFRHPAPAPRLRYACEENVRNYIDARCSPPAPRPMPTRFSTDRYVKDSAVLWVAHESQGGDTGKPLPSVQDVIDTCCIDIAHQCDCFFHWGERGTPTERVCDAVLTAAFYRPPPCAAAKSED